MAPTSPATGVVVLLRAFHTGKARLADRLDTATRAEMVREWAKRVVRAAGARPVAVVSSDPDVVTWAERLGPASLPDPGSLDDAASAGRRWAAARGYGRVIVTHADLPLATSFDALDLRDRDRVAAVPCHRDDGTTVLSVPTDLDFRFSYGPGSFRRHRAEARRLGAAFARIEDPTLRFDVDLPSDLDVLDAYERATPRP